jgi:acyl-CoA thioesterase I
MAWTTMSRSSTSAWVTFCAEHRGRPARRLPTGAGWLRLLSLIAAGLLAAGMPGGANAAPLAILGSSTAAGTGTSDPSLSWAGRLNTWLQKTEGNVVENLAVPGALTASALCSGAPARPARALRTAPDSRTMDQALATGARRVILAFPSNDAVAGVPAEQTLANIRQMTLCARAKGAQVAVLSSLPRAGLTPAQRKTIQRVDEELKASFGACFLDLRDTLTNGSRVRVRAEYDAGDGIHFNDLGHLLIFRQVRQFIETGRCL